MDGWKDGRLEGWMLPTVPSIQSSNLPSFHSSTLPIFHPSIHPVFQSYQAEFVKYTPELTKTAPLSRDTVMGSRSNRKARITALMGTKLIKILARAGPIRLMPS
jgi:hypothetical protein